MSFCIRFLFLCRIRFQVGIYLLLFEDTSTTNWGFSWSAAHFLESFQLWDSTIMMKDAKCSRLKFPKSCEHLARGLVPFGHLQGLFERSMTHFLCYFHAYMTENFLFDLKHHQLLNPLICSSSLFSDPSPTRSSWLSSPSSLTSLQTYQQADPFAVLYSIHYTYHLRDRWRFGPIAGPDWLILWSTRACLYRSVVMDLGCLFWLDAERSGRLHQAWLFGLCCSWRVDFALTALELVSERPVCRLRSCVGLASQWDPLQASATSQ